MTITPRLFFILYFVFIGLSKINSQFVFYNEDRQLTFPYGGGLRNPQFSSFDFNKDGHDDLFCFDRATFLASVYINKGVQMQVDYSTDSMFVSALPRLYHWALIRDFNYDGVPDIFTAPENDKEKMVVWKGIQNSEGNLAFLEYNGYKPLEEKTDSISRITIKIPFVSTSDVYDVDGDADLDLLFFNNDETSLTVLKNISNHPDSLFFGDREDCFGRFRINVFDSSVDLSDNQDECADGMKIAIVHGGSSVTGYDLNCDGLVDVILGDGKTNKLNFLSNGGEPGKDWMTNVTNGFPNDKARISSWMTACFSDMDNDGITDVLTSQLDGLNGQSRKHIRPFINKSSDCVPADFEPCCDDFLTEEMLYFGVASHPAAVDIDLDGYKDLVVGSHEVDSTGKFIPKLSFWMNRADGDLRTFVLTDGDFLQLSSFQGISGGRAAPAFGDLDDDGDYDLIVGDGYGRLHFFQNEAEESMTAVFSDPVIDFGSLYVGLNAVPFISDIDGDGLNDLTISRWRHGVHFYRNIGSKGFPQFNPDPAAPGNLADLGNMFLNYSDPDELNGAISFYENEEMKYAVMGYRGGQLRAFRVGNDQQKDFEEINFDFPFFGRNVSPAVADLNNDGYAELILGNEAGGIMVVPHFLDKGSATENHTYDRLRIFPSPAYDKVGIEFGDAVNAEVYDFSGRKVNVVFRQCGSQCAEADISYLFPGLYFVRAKNRTTTKYSAFLKI